MHLIQPKGVIQDTLRLFKAWRPNVLFSYLPRKHPDSMIDMSGIMKNKNEERFDLLMPIQMTSTLAKSYHNFNFEWTINMANE